MSKTILAILLAAAGSFAGGWSNPAPVTQILYLQGAGSDQGKTILQIVQNGTSYYVKSDNPVYPKILEVIESSLAGAKRVQLYYNADPVPFTYLGGQATDYSNTPMPVTSSALKPVYSIARFP